MKTLIIDSSYLMYKSYFAYPNLSYNLAGIDTPVGAFFGFVKTILTLLTEYKHDQLVFAGDTNKPTWRHLLATEVSADVYKGGRAEIEPNLVSQIPLIQNWCHKITQNDYRLEGWEADDIIFSIAIDELTDFQSIRKQKVVEKYSAISDNLFEKPSSNPSSIHHFPARFDELLQQANQQANSIYIYSSDRDLYQMLSLPNLYFIHTGKLGYEVFGAFDFVNKYTLSPLQWLDYKAMVGDGSDNLKGVEGVGTKTATSFLQNVGSLYSFFGHFEDKVSLETNLEKQFDKAPFLRTAGGCWNAPSQIQLDTKTDIKSSSKQKLLEYINNPKNQKLIQKIKDNYEVIKYTYLMSSLQPVPSVRFQPTGFAVSSGIADLEKFGFKSLITMSKKQEPQLEIQEGLF